MWMNRNKWKIIINLISEIHGDVFFLNKPSRKVVQIWYSTYTVSSFSFVVVCCCSTFKSRSPVTRFSISVPFALAVDVFGLWFIFVLAVCCCVRLYPVWVCFLCVWHQSGCISGRNDGSWGRRIASSSNLSANMFLSQWVCVQLLLCITQCCRWSLQWCCECCTCCCRFCDCCSVCCKCRTCCLSFCCKCCMYCIVLHSKHAKQFSSKLILVVFVASSLDLLDLLSFTLISPILCWLYSLLLAFVVAVAGVVTVADVVLVFVGVGVVVVLIPDAILL